MPNYASREISFKVSKTDSVIIGRVVLRAIEVGLYTEAQLTDAAMDLEATHANGCPLDFQKLLDFDAFNFAHDVAGIRNCLDRTTGRLRKNFLPRCARPARRRAVKRTAREGSHA